MANLKVIDGDFEKGKSAYRAGAFALTPTGGSRQKIPVAELTTLEVVTEENATKVGAAIGWGLVGTLVMPGVGTAVGAWLKGKKKEVTLVARFKDGRKLLAVADKKTFAEIKGTYLLEIPIHAQPTTATDTSEAAIVEVSGGIDSADSGAAEDKPEFTVFLGPTDGFWAGVMVDVLTQKLI